MISTGTVAAFVPCMLTALLFVTVTEEFAFQLRTLDDPSVLPDKQLCAEADFHTNMMLSATVWSTVTGPRTGEVIDDTRKQVGTGTACFGLTDFTFPVGNTFPVRARFVLTEGTFTGQGECRVTSNDKPEKGLVLAACSATVTDGPKGFVGGVATTTTVINAFRLPGYETGSYLTIRGYRQRIERPWWWWWRMLEEAKE